MANTQTATGKSVQRLQSELRELEPAEVGRDVVQYLREYAREPGVGGAVVLRHRLRSGLEAEDLVGH